MKTSDIFQFENILNDAEDNAKTNWEMDFCQDISDRYDKYGDNCFVSAKQIETLEKIAGY